MARFSLHRFIGLLLFSLATLALQPLALAQDLSPEEIARFQEHVRLGSELIEAEEFRLGIEQLLFARQMVDHPTISLSIARAYRDWGRCSAAQEEYSNLLERDQLSDDVRGAIARGLRRMPECQELAEVRVFCEPEEALLSIAGEEHPCPAQLDLPLGEYTLNVSAEGYHSFAETIRFTPNDLLEIHAILTPIPRSAEPFRPELRTQEEIDYLAFAGIATAAVGAGLLVGGFVVDLGAANRTDEIAMAHSANDRALLQDLEDQARSARLTAGILYGSGLLLVGSGVALHFLYPSLSSRDQAPGHATLRPHIQWGPTSVSTTWSW